MLKVSACCIVPSVSSEALIVLKGTETSDARLHTEITPCVIKVTGNALNIEYYFW